MGRHGSVSRCSPDLGSDMNRKERDRYDEAEDEANS